MSKVFYNPEENRLRAFWRILIQFALFFAVMVLLQAIFGVGVLIAGRVFGIGSSSTASTQSFILNALIAPVLAALSGLGAIWISYWIAARWIDHRPMRAYGLHRTGAWRRDFVFGLVLGALIMAFIFVIELSAGWITITDTFWSSMPGFFVPAMVVIVILYICVGFYEEMLFRGFGLLNLAEGFNSPRVAPKTALLLAWIVSSVIFGIAHGLNPNATLVSTIDLMAAGLFLGFGYILTGELAIPIGAHITWNIFEGPVFGFAVSGQGNGAGFLALQQGGPVALTGGAFGPEAGLVGLLAIVLGLAIIWLWVRWTHGSARLQGDMAVYTPRFVMAAPPAAATGLADGDPPEIENQS